MKKVLISILVLVGLVVGAAFVIPFVVDVDKYRPQIVEKANEQINGKVEIGHLALNLWGNLKVSIDGVKVADARGRLVLSVKDANVNLPWMSLLTGKPELRLQLQAPEIEVLKQRDGKMNVLALVKETPPAAPTAPGTPPATNPQAAPSKPMGIPAIALSARFTFLLEHAKLTYRDETTSDVYKVDDLNFALRDVSISGKMPFELTAALDLVVSKTMKVKGPLVLRGTAQAFQNAGAFDRAEVDLALVMDGLSLSQPGTIEKAPGVPLGLDVNLTATKSAMKASSLVFRIADVSIRGEVATETVGTVTNVNFKAQSNSIDLAKLGGLLAAVKEYGINGNAEFSAEAKGPTDKLNYAAQLKFNHVMLNNEALRQPVEASGQVDVATDQLKSLSLKLAAHEFDFRLSGALESFAKPRFKFSIASNGMDLDGLLKSSEKAAETRKAQAQAGNTTSAPGGAGAKPVVDYNALFQPVRTNPFLAGMAGALDFDVKKLTSTGVSMQNLKGQLVLANLVIGLNNFMVSIFDGSIKGQMSFDVKPPKPTVGVNFTLAGIETKRMMESQVPLMKNTVQGVFGANLNVGGSGLNQSDIQTNWKGNGYFDFRNARISTIDIGGQLRDGFMAKLPAIAKGKVNIPDSVLNWKGDYDQILMKFALASGVFHINELTGKSHPRQGLDLKGTGTVKLADYGLQFDGDLIDTYDLCNLGGYKDPKYKHGAVPLIVGNTVMSPRVDWGAATTRIAENIGKAKLNAAKDQVVNQLHNAVSSGQAPKPEEAVKAFKGLFGH